MTEHVDTTNSLSKILVGTDLSDAARVAFDWAVEIARAHGAELLLIHARASSGAEVADTETGLAELLSAAESTGLSARSEIRDGAPWRVLAEVAKAESADLIVVGARGHTMVLPLLLGHTADRLIRISRTPVMCIHPRDPRHEPGPRTVLAATDFSAEGNAAAAFGARLLHGVVPDGKLVLVNIEPTPLFYESAPPATAAAHDVPDITAKRVTRLEQVAAPLRDQGVEVEAVVTPGYAPTAIVAEAESHHADVIVLGTRGESALEAMLIGSVAERVMHHASRPVILVSS